VALTTRVIGSEEQPERVRLHGQAPSSPYFPVALIVFRWRMNREFDTIVRLSFSLLEGPSPNDAIFLGKTPTASEEALLCDFLPRLYGALHPGYSNGVPLSLSSFPAGEKQRTYRLLGQAVLSCLGDVS